MNGKEKKNTEKRKKYISLSRNRERLNIFTQIFKYGGQYNA